MSSRPEHPNLIRLPHYEITAIPGEEIQIQEKEIPSDKLELKPEKVVISKIVYPTPKQRNEFKVVVVYPAGDKIRQYPLSFIDRIKQTGDTIAVYFTDPEGWTVQPDTYANARFGFSKYFQKKR